MRDIILHSSPGFLTRAGVYHAHRSTITDCIACSQCRRCQSQRHQLQCDHDHAQRYRMIWAHWHRKITGLATASAAPTQVSLYHGQSGCQRSSGFQFQGCPYEVESLYVRMALRRIDLFACLSKLTPMSSTLSRQCVSRHHQSG